MSYLRWLGDRGLDERHLLPQFLHEFTHHWCFQSLAGSTLALIELRLNTFAAACPGGRPIWARDLIGYRHLSHLMRPLGEGMAQIAEFDLRPMTGDAHPATPLGVAGLCFSVTADDIFRLTMMQFLRNTPEVLERKASLYLRPFEVNDGYLPGYMAVKNIAFSMFGRDDNLPVEMLLTYLRSYFWDDPVYTNILLSAEMDGIKIANAVSGRFRDRMFSLFTEADVPARIRSFWAKWDPSDPMRGADELNVGATEYAEAYERVATAEQRYLQLLRRDSDAVEAATGTPVTRLARLLPELSVTRRFAPIAATDVEVSPDGDVDPGIPLPEPLPAGRHRLRVFTPTTGAKLVLTAEDKAGEVRLLRTWPPGSGAGADLLSYPRYLSSITRTVPRLRERFLAEGLPVIDSPVVTALTEEIYEDVLDLYSIAATARVAENDRAAAVRSRLRATGLRSVFGRDVTAVRLVAGMSLVGERAGMMLPELANFTYGQIGLAQMHFLPDDDYVSLRQRLDRVLARDPDALVLKEIEDNLVIFV